MPPLTAPADLTDDGYVLEDQIGYVLRVVSQRHASIFQALAPEGLTPRQFSALVRLGEVGRASQNQLGRMTSMDVATIKGVVDRLNRKGLVALEADPDDKRRTLIRLTQRAEGMIGRLHEVGRQISQDTVAPLNRAEQDTLLELLRKIS